MFKAMDINHQSCPQSYKLSNDLSKTTHLHSTINILKRYVDNYATFDGLVNGVDGFCKTSTYCEKPIIWIMF
jgi:hypothetical protein